MLYDLHVHTQASDGVESPEQIIINAMGAGLTGLAITDHDTIDGLEPAREYIEKNQLELDFIPGIELNTDFGKDEVHILGYFIDFHNEYLKRRLLEIRLQRYMRAEKIVDQLQLLGLHVSLEHVQRLAQGGLIGRPHIARALVQNSYVGSEDEAFHKYIDRGKPAYVPRYKFLPSEAIYLIQQAGGIAVLAHPGLIKDSEKINEIINMGIEGLEVYYPEHSPEQIFQFTRLAEKHNLLITGGSDFHGPGSSESRNMLGSTGIDEDMVDRIRNYYRIKMKK
jgi:predicted metal-dependent phosphoesterase TrpH